jgi:enterochelin esterase-like enzyme
MPIEAAQIETLGLHLPIPAEVNGRQNGAKNNPDWEKGYLPCLEATLAEGVQEGTVTPIKDWRDSKIYPGTSRNISLYQTPGMTADDQPSVIWFNDGAWYLSREGPVRATNVLNNLFARGEIGPTLGIFVTPGQPDHEVPGPIESYDKIAAQRSLEYDTVSGQYGEFLFYELLAVANNVTGVKATNDPTRRTVCGISSGGIAAFSAAWFHPDLCQRVISHCGSFTDIWGGHNYPSLIRKTPRKPLRIFLQSGSNDANTPFGDWALANQTIASALDYAGYDYRFEFGRGGHSLNHGGALFAQSLRWLLR